MTRIAACMALSLCSSSAVVDDPYFTDIMATHYNLVQVCIVINAISVYPIVCFQIVSIVEVHQLWILTDNAIIRHHVIIVLNDVIK